MPELRPRTTVDQPLFCGEHRAVPALYVLAINGTRVGLCGSCFTDLAAQTEAEMATARRVPTRAPRNSWPERRTAGMA